MWRVVFVLAPLISSGVFAAERSMRFQVGITITGPSKSGASSPQMATGTIAPRQPTAQGSAVDPGGNISSTQGVTPPGMAASEP
jgi:hypothetical protein